MGEREGVGEAKEDERNGKMNQERKIGEKKREGERRVTKGNVGRLI